MRCAVSSVVPGLRTDITNVRPHRQAYLALGCVLAVVLAAAWHLAGAVRRGTAGQ